MALENTNNSVEIDGIEFETIIPNSELKFSDKGANFLPSLESANDLNRIPPFAGREKQMIQLGIQLRNNTSTPLYFSNYETLIPEMIDSEGEKVHVGAHIDGIRLPSRSNYLLVAPQESINIFPLSALLSNENGLEICIYSETGMFFCCIVCKKISQETQPRIWHLVDTSFDSLTSISIPEMCLN